MSASLIEQLCYAEQSQLLIIDIQERLAAAMPHEVIEKVINNSNILLQAADELAIPVIHSEQYPQGLGKTVPLLAENINNRNTITKTRFSCSGDDEFNNIVLKNKRKQIIISGIEAHVCVLQTALQLQQQGFLVYVVADAVCSRKKFNYKNAIARLRQAGIIVTNVESVLFEWLRDSAHPQFKSLSKLIK